MANSAPGSGCSKYPGALSKVALAQIEQKMKEDEVAFAVIETLVEAGDLHSLAVLNERGVQGASDAYNGAFVTTYREMLAAV